MRDFCKGQIAHYKVPRYVRFERSIADDGDRQAAEVRDAQGDDRGAGREGRADGLSSPSLRTRRPRAHNRSVLKEGVAMTRRNTSTPARARLGVALGLLGAVCIASAQGNVDQKLAMRYGGVLALECGDYLQPQLLYPGDSLLVRVGGKPVLTGRNVRGRSHLLRRHAAAGIRDRADERGRARRKAGLRPLSQRVGPLRDRRGLAQGHGRGAECAQGKAGAPLRPEPQRGAGSEAAGGRSTPACCSGTRSSSGPTFRRSVPCASEAG